MSQAMQAFSEECSQGEVINGAPRSLNATALTAGSLTTVGLTTAGLTTVSTMNQSSVNRSDRQESSDSSNVVNLLRTSEYNADNGPEKSPEKSEAQSTRDEDSVLIAKVQAGDKRAFDLLVQKHQRGIARVVSQYLKDPDTINDVVQETFIRAYKGLARFRQDSQFYTWLYRIAVNTAYNQLRTVQRWQNMVDIDDDYHQGELAEPLSIGGPDRDLHNEDLGAAIKRAVNRLPLELKTALLLRELEDMSYEQIAEVVNCRVGTVKSRISRAREQVMKRTEHLYKSQA